jgi:hypothetical protein
MSLSIANLAQFKRSLALQQEMKVSQEKDYKTVPLVLTEEHKQLATPHELLFRTEKGKLAFVAYAEAAERLIARYPTITMDDVERRINWNLRMFATNMPTHDMFPPTNVPMTMEKVTELGVNLVLQIGQACAFQKTTPETGQEPTEQELENVVEAERKPIEDDVEYAKLRADALARRDSKIERASTAFRHETQDLTSHKIQKLMKKLNDTMGDDKVDLGEEEEEEEKFNFDLTLSVNTTVNQDEAQLARAMTEDLQKMIKEQMPLRLKKMIAAAKKKKAQQESATQDV